MFSGDMKIVASLTKILFQCLESDDDFRNQTETRKIVIEKQSFFELG